MSNTAALDLRNLIRTATGSLTHAGIPDARWEAEMLIAHTLRCTRSDLYRSEALSPDPQQHDRLTDLVRRRSRHEPLQYLMGTQEFWGLEFRVRPNVFIPRPETELLIEAVLGLIPKAPTPMTLIDLGTGTGCLAVTLSKLYPNSRTLATDLSPAALEIAHLNARLHGTAKRIEFIEGDLFEPLIPLGLDGRVDLFVTNPPYVPTSEIGHLQPEVRLHEPRLAFDGGSDGLDYYRRILPQALSLLHPCGFLCLEVGIAQADPVCVIAERVGWRLMRILRDLRDIPRVVILTKAGSSSHG